MSEEIASADALLTANADLSRRVGELNTTIGYQDAMIAELRHVLRLAQPDVCSLNCPSVWKTADGPPPHSDKCQAISAALATDHPGRALLAELEAARAFIRAISGAMLIGGWSDEQEALMAAYDAARKANDHAT